MLTTVVLICWGNGAIPYHFLCLLTFMPPPGISLGFIGKGLADSYLEGKQYFFFSPADSLRSKLLYRLTKQQGSQQKRYDILKDSTKKPTKTLFPLLPFCFICAPHVLKELY